MKSEIPIAILGGNGQLGAELRALLGAAAAPLARPEVDMRDPDSLRRAFERLRPDVVINCAAQTHVDGCESQPREAFEINAVGALFAARAAREAGARLVYVSTDYVFGAPGGPWRESDTPSPCNVYGASKLAGEHLTLATCPDALIVRTSGLYGHAGARGKGGNFVETMLRLAREGRPLRVVADQRLAPTSAIEYARTLLDLVRCGASGVVHVAARDSCTWNAFAQAILDYEGFEQTVTPITSAQYAAPARRPMNSALVSERLEGLGLRPCPVWPDMLRDYLRARTSAANAVAGGVSA